MEYRRRRRTVHREARNDARPAYYAAAALFLLVAGLIGFSRPSTWVVKRVLSPVFSGKAIAGAVSTQSEPPVDAAVSASVETRQRTYVLPANTCYALQIGIYEDEANARAQAEKLMQLGAAGRIAEDGGRYRVLASGYPTQADAKTVQRQLMTEGIESYVCPVQCAERTYTIRGDEAQTEAFCEALDGVAEVLDELYAAMIAFDRDGKGAAGGLPSVRAAAERCQTHAETLSRLPADSEGQIAALLAFYRALSDEAAETADMEAAETVKLSARLKALYLSAVYRRKALSSP